MLAATANVVVIIVVVAAVNVAIVIVSIAVVALAFVLHRPLILLSCRLVVACGCLLLLLASLPHVPLWDDCCVRRTLLWWYGR